MRCWSDGRPGKDPASGPPRGSGRYGADGGAAPPEEIIKAQAGIMESDDSLSDDP
jgi:hypothetical protein